MMSLDAFVINPLLDLLCEYKKVDKTGAQYAAEEMIEVLQRREAYEEFPQSQPDIEMLNKGSSRPSQLKKL